MQATSLDETANVSWVDAVVTKGYAPEEVHTQQIPGWEIRDYSTALEPFTLKEENIELKQWGLDVTQKLTDGVRDLPGIVFYRCPPLDAAEIDIPFLGHVDSYIKDNFFYNERYEYFNGNTRFIEWDDTKEVGNVFKVEEAVGGSYDSDGNFIGNTNMDAWSALVGKYVCITFAERRTEEAMVLPYGETLDPPVGGRTTSGWAKRDRWYRYLFKEWNINTGKSVGEDIPITGTAWHFHYVKLTHFDHIGRRRMRLANGGSGGGNNGAVNGVDETLTALGDWNGLVYQSVEGKADWNNATEHGPGLKGDPTDRHMAVWHMDPATNPDHRLDPSSVVAPHITSNNSNVVSPDRTCARWITAGTVVTHEGNEYTTLYDCKAHDAGTMPDLVGGGHAFNPWWATPNKALTLTLADGPDLSARYFDGAGAASTFKDVIKTAPWEDFTIKFNTGNDPSPYGHYNRNWLRVGPEHRHGRRYPKGHLVSAPGSSTPGEISNTACLFTDSDAPSGTFLQTNDKGPAHLADEDWWPIGGSHEEYNNGAQLYQFTETSPPATYNFANAANSRERSDKSDSILPTQYLAKAVDKK